jgi:hypothetical protein
MTPPPFNLNRPITHDIKQVYTFEPSFKENLFSASPKIKTHKYFG